ncbi:MAG TPA: aminoglycoside phosphotransferase family protein, partial [Mycobacteriales bacterium]|nr:aminoglycoside phosphotransferase family protein [Mycobacteriales bacterium]
SYAEWQLAHPSAPPSVLSDLVRRTTGTEIARMERIVEGYSNEVYRIWCTGGHDLVIRILRFDDDVGSAAAASEAAAIDRARAAGVPVPEILLLDAVRIDGAEFPAMVQRTVPGVPLSAVIGTLSGRERYNVLTRIGELIARINTIRIGGEQDWPTTMAAVLADRHAGRGKILTAGFSARQFDQIIAALHEYTRDFPCAQWVLCHGDLSTKHIFVTGRPAVHVSGIIDFGDWQPGAPVHDLAVLRVRNPELDLRPLIAGYGPAADAAYRWRLDRHTLLIALGSLEFAVSEHDRPAIESSTRLIRALIAKIRAR